MSPSIIKTNYIAFFVFAAILALIAPCFGDSSPHNNQINSGGNKGIPQPEHWTIHVANQLGASRTLVAHCKSKDDDLGERNLTPGSEFNWSFRQSFMGTTNFTCYFRTDHQHIAHQVFWCENVRKSYWLHYRCNKDNHCFWIAKDDGIYLKNVPEERDELQHLWEMGW